MPVGDPQFNRQQDQTNASRISLGGGGVRANNYLVDGVAITELTGRAVLNPSIEGIDEVKVQVHTYDADMGRTGGGVFNTTAKSGTNQYHGTGFYQGRPVWGQSENYFNAIAGLSKEQTGLANAKFHTYGGGIGGPIWENRTFFWSATEGYRSTTTRNVQEIWPGLKQRNGDFSPRRSAGRRSGSSTRGAGAASRAPGVLRPGRGRSRPAASSPERSSRAPTRRPIRSASTWSTRFPPRIPAAMPSAPTRTT